ncbi:MAG: hypothetical protein A3B30_00215 [Candidatus Komeilibacteria bacterium RIFCSPLOWO2_01_FULL_52_15]|uniref:Undecaprenyl-phosphate alpha-N-acetylglucosaminyl 1-phosphate transferase n=2 Tax=Candidatus Komeiliibacteriota TaxID=1817908 RepID=A0A1G2BPG4_9BACT|nr:MAG: hypothetical protein A2677_01785 [Candidatus Komeilibacteria bacterium RIFCSPHIGHO2_01_FULL_52_14]OGY91002.1 MAG: hypothetical protein A3B30_00215 [Candidatus Komeilibacteria bacterium RIFCSPLOWO2_01_FULL_52_15]
MLALQSSGVALVAGLVAVAATYFVMILARVFGFMDAPAEARKIHNKPVPLLGGVALFVALGAATVFAYSQGYITDTRVSPRLIVALFGAGAVLNIVGALDDRFRLRWWQQAIGPLAAVGIMLAAGLDIPFVSNPFGSGTLNLQTASILGSIVPVGKILVLVWLVGMMYTTKLLDGIDGLATSVSGVAALVLFMVSLTWDRSGSVTSFLSAGLAGAAAGFLVWNFFPAKIFLGEGGSTFLGLLLAVLAILSGGKIATALLIMGVPILDVVWLIVRRLIAGQHVFTGDNRHLHFRLLRAGLSQRQVVLLLSGLSLLFGSVSFFYTTRVKIIALAVLVAFVLILEALLTSRYENSPHR